MLLPEHDEVHDEVHAFTRSPADEVLHVVCKFGRTTCPPAAQLPRSSAGARHHLCPGPSHDVAEHTRGIGQTAYASPG
jgi:hypothetical protein